MADQSISQLPVAQVLTGNEVTVLVQGGVTKQASIQLIASVVQPGKLITNVVLLPNYDIEFFYSDGTTSIIGPIPGFTNAYINGSGHLILVETDGTLLDCGNAVGPSGYSGTSGFSGFSGKSGFSGISGYSGFSGISGYSGFSGISGYSGFSGISGYSGFSGISGYSGFSGISGYSGFSGISGYSGDSGISGFSGDSGISGFSGDSGISGYSGESGLSGFSGFSGEQGTSINLKGEVPTVDDLPTEGNQPNDAYIVTADGNLWVWNGSAWFDAGQIVGPQGLSGFSGFSGYSGISGYSGELGGSGYSGISGYSGDSGISGYSGSGVSGYSGESGYSGFSGISGYSGTSGFSGDSGFSGYSGDSGISGYSGDSGISGYSGVSGYSGDSGISGYSGVSGYSGDSGISGFSGFSGISGYSGDSGISGYSGISGFSGDSGISGYSGWSGDSGISGWSGTSGYSGLGLSGYSGYSGISGYSGTAPVDAVIGPASATDNAIARFDGTTGKLIQNSAVTIDDAGNIISPDSVQFSGTVPATQPIGTLWFDSTTDTLNLQQNAITQQIGEEIYVYGKASNTITGQTILQAIVKTGVVGASGFIAFGVAGAGVTDGGTFIGVATEDIATNSFGRITNFGIVHGINTTGSTYGETWVDGQDIWYDPVTGGLTKTKPVAPNIKVQIGTVISAGPGGSGSFQVLLNTGSSLGGTDDNVQITSPLSGNILTYNGTYWYNATSVAGGTF